MVLKWKKSRKGQSMVEIAVSLPVLLMILSGLVEFGFMLNYYLSLVDATREVARAFSNFSPINQDGTDNMAFYTNAVDAFRANLAPLNPADPKDNSRKVALDPAHDDILISVFSIAGGNITRFPTSTGGVYHGFNNGFNSRFTNADVQSRLISGAPNTGILLVEVFYYYHQVLSLPWIKVFIPDPVLLHAYTMMPISAAEPTPTP